MGRSAPGGADDAPQATEESLVAEQIGFYEADARAYQAWLDGLDADDSSAPEAVEHRERRRRLVHLVDRLRPTGRVLELAAGTGRFSSIVAAHASALLLVDSSPESLAIARARVGPLHQNVEYVLADVFRWEPEEHAFDVVCFAAWLHHVPLGLFPSFWATVDRALAPGGRVIFDFADAAHARRATPPPTPSVLHAAYPDPDDDMSVRDLGGVRWTVVHRVWEQQDLDRALGDLGWRLSVELTEANGFHWATATRC